MLFLILLFGALVGFSLGLTGGGGAIFAVPLLVYGLGVPAREAVGVSLLTVGSTALVGFVQRAWRNMVEFPTGLLFAVAGMIGAPIGSWLADKFRRQYLIKAAIGGWWPRVPGLSLCRAGRAGCSHYILPNYREVSRCCGLRCLQLQPVNQQQKSERAWMVGEAAHFLPLPFFLGVLLAGESVLVGSFGPPPNCFQYSSL
jgi:hypothetical protein